MFGVKIRRLSGLVAISAISVIGRAELARGDTFNAYADYGHATNGYTDHVANANLDTNATHYNVGPYCGATSIANSLQFLANKYGGVYSSLIDGSVQNTRDDIVDMETLQGQGAPETGQGVTGAAAVSNATIWNSKVDYINSRGLANNVKIEAMIPGGTQANGYENSANIINGTPTLAWLQEQINAGQDVEISFSWPTNVNEGANEELDGDAQGVDAHMVVLTGMSGNVFDYLDPNNPGQLIDDNTFTVDVNGVLHFSWDNDNNPAVTDVTVEQAWAESVTPLPNSVYGGLLMFAFIGAVKLHQKNAKAM